MKKFHSVNSVLKDLVPIFKRKVPIDSLDYWYFASAIRGGKGNLNNRRVIVNELEKYAKVIPKHSVLDDVELFEEKWRKLFPKINIWKRDVRLIRYCRA